jgi:hypothetical protein
MKLHKSIFACAFFLLSGAAWLGAAPAAVDAPMLSEALAADEVTIPYTAVFEAPADCAAAKAAVSASFDPGICSPLCAQVVCRNKPVNSPCGFGIGPQRYCYEEPIVCSDGPACRCTNAPP